MFVKGIIKETGNCVNELMITADPETEVLRY